MRKGNFTYRRENSMIIEQGEYLHLQGKNISYILRIHKAGYLLHHYFGKKTETERLYLISCVASFLLHLQFR